MLARVVVALLIFMLCVNSGNTACLMSTSCQPDVNGNFITGSSYKTSSCQSCTCHRFFIKKFCDQLRPPMKKDDGDAPPEITVMKFETDNIADQECPIGTVERKASEISDLTILLTIEYFQAREFESCCDMYITPTSYSPLCYKQWNQEECRFDLLRIDTKEKCEEGPYAAVGK